MTLVEGGRKSFFITNTRRRKKKKKKNLTELINVKKAEALNHFFTTRRSLLCCEDREPWTVLTCRQHKHLHRTSAQMKEFRKKTKTFHFYRATLTPLSQKIQLKNNLFLLRLIRDLPLWHFCNVPVIEDKTWTTPNDSHQFRTPDHKTLVRLARCFTRTPVIITRERKRPRPRNRHKQLYTQEKDGSVSCSDAHSSSTVNIITGTVCWRRYSEDISLWV